MALHLVKLSFSELREELGISAGVDELVADYYIEYPSKFSVDPGTIEGVRLLRSLGFKVGVVTNGPPSQWSKLEAAGIAEEFDAVCISAVVGSWKPDLPIFRKAAEVCDVALEGWMVGDSAEADIVGGANAGLRTIWIARGRNWTLDSLRPDHIVDSIPRVDRCDPKWAALTAGYAASTQGVGKARQCPRPELGGHCRM